MEQGVAPRPEPVKPSRERHFLIDIARHPALRCAIFCRRERSRSPAVALLFRSGGTMRTRRRAWIGCCSFILLSGGVRRQPTRSTPPTSRASSRTPVAPRSPTPPLKRSTWRHRSRRPRRPTTAGNYRFLSLAPGTVQAHGRGQGLPQGRSQRHPPDQPDTERSDFPGGRRDH